MFLGISTLAWCIIGLVALIAALIVVAGWYVMYVVFDWGVHYVKHVWRDDK